MASLFDLIDLPAANPICRTTDPETSAAAGHDLTESGERGRMMAVALAGLTRRPGLTAKELESWLGYSDGAVRKRLNDLREAGQAHVGESRRCNITGRSAQTWWPGPAAVATVAAGEWSDWTI